MDDPKSGAQSHARRAAFTSTDARATLKVTRALPADAGSRASRGPFKRKRRKARKIKVFNREMTEIPLAGRLVDKTRVTNYFVSLSGKINFI